MLSEQTEQRQKQGPGQCQKRQRLLELGFYRSRSICLQKPCDSGDFATSATQIRRSESQGHSNFGRKNSSSDFLYAQKQTAIQRNQMLRHRADKKHQEEIGTQAVEGGCSCGVANCGRPSLGISHVLYMLMYRIVKPSKPELGGCSAIENAYPE